MSLNMPKEKYHCPRCGGFEYNESFNCFKCRLEFEKQDCDEFDDEDILAIEEKMAFLDAFHKKE